MCGEDCNDFKPERWIENGVYKSESPFRYPVFHAGPRLCLGKDLAYVQMKSVAASVLQLFDVDALNKDTCLEYLYVLTLRMKEGLPVKTGRPKWAGREPTHFWAGLDLLGLKIQVCLCPDHGPARGPIL